MSSLVAGLFNLALVLMEESMMLLLADGFFVQKKSSHFVNISFLVAALLGVAVLCVVGQVVAVKLISLTLIFSLWLYLCYETKAINCIYPAIFWLAYLTVCDAVILSMISVFVDKSAAELMSSPDSYYFICYSIKVAELLGIVILSTWLKRNFIQSYTPFLSWIKVSTLPVGALLISIFLLKIYYHMPDMSAELALCSAIILFVDLVSVFLLNYLEKQQEIVRDNIILRQSMKTELDNVEAWRKAYDGQRKQTHDFHNQLMVIHGMVRQQYPAGEILSYIERLMNTELPGATMIMKTHRTAVDIILNQKYAIAESRDILFSSQLDDLSGFPLTDLELVTVLSNLIDNAIEACERIADPQARYITLHMKVESRAAFLHIENPTAAPVKIENNHIVTTKKKPLEHGYGLQNVVSVLEKHQVIYLLNYDAERGVFSFSAQIPMD